LDSDAYKKKRIRIREALYLPPRGYKRAKNLCEHDQSLYRILAYSVHFFEAMDISCLILFSKINFPLKFLLFFLKAKNKGGLTTPQKMLRQKFSKPEGEDLNSREESPHHPSAGEEEGETVTNTSSQKTSQLDKSAERKGPIKAVPQIMFKKRLFLSPQNRTFISFFKDEKSKKVTK
jgi:hypothetical protein